MAAKKDIRKNAIREALRAGGCEPSERQLDWAVAFCTPGRCYRDSIKAARLVGYPDPESGGDMCYAEMGLILHKLIQEEDSLALEVYQVVAQQLKATTDKVITHQGLVTDIVTQVDNSARLAAAKLGAELLGLKAPEKSEITLFDPAERLRRAEERLRAGE